MRRAALALVPLFGNPLLTAALGGGGVMAATEVHAQEQPERALSEVERNLAISRARDAELARSAEALENELLGLRQRLVQAADQATRPEPKASTGLASSS